jgi:hypothetical protein
MSRISRTKLLDREHDKRSARLFIIATEGKETEKQYFSLFHSTRIKIEILATGEDNKSAPQYVLDRLDEFANKYDLTDEDSLWLMVDTDRWIDRHKVKNFRVVCQEARKKGYYLAISNPCFEVWLYLHFDELIGEFKLCKEIEAKIRNKVGSYNKSNLDLSLYEDKINDAIARAKALDTNPRQYWIKSTGTRVYKIVEVLLPLIDK